MDSEKNRQALSVSQAEAGQKLLNFLQRRVEASAGEFHRWIRTGQVRVNGSRAKAFDRVEEGDMVRVPPFAVFLPAGSEDREHLRHESARSPQSKHERPEKKSASLHIVYEDEDLLVIAKPAGLPVQGRPAGLAMTRTSSSSYTMLREEGADRRAASGLGICSVCSFSFSLPAGRKTAKGGTRTKSPSATRSKALARVPFTRTCPVRIQR